MDQTGQGELLVILRDTALLSLYSLLDIDSYQ